MSRQMQPRYDHGSLVQAVRACANDDATDLIAVAGEHSVHVIQVLEPVALKQVASFHVGSRVTALSWSPKTVSPSAGSHWFIELAAAGADYGLRLLTKSPLDNKETIFEFGGGTSGHHGKVTDMVFCGGLAEDCVRYVATVSDDRMLMVWDLHPVVNTVSPSVADDDTLNPPDRPQPTAYVIPFLHPLTSVMSHPSTSKDVLVADSRGSIFLTDWRTDPLENGEQNWRHHSLVEFVEPRVLAAPLSYRTSHSSSSVGWRKDAVDTIGATFGSVISIWDMSKIQGGRPRASIALADVGNHFRWCPTHPDLFAVSTHSGIKGSSILVYNSHYVNAQPLLTSFAGPPQIISDFDFMAARGVPRIVAAVGQMVVILELQFEN